MQYAEVSVNSPVARRRTFSYSIPAHLALQAGQAVLVPFGQRLLQGIVFELTDQPAVEETREIVSACLLYTSPSPRDLSTSRMPSSA